MDQITGFKGRLTESCHPSDARAAWWMAAWFPRSALPEEEGPFSRVSEVRDVLTLKCPRAVLEERCQEKHNQNS